MHWSQSTITLQAKPQGIHLVTREVVDQVHDLTQIETGMANLFLQHTSAALALNEGVEPEVRADLHTFFGQLVPEDAAYTHNYEGPDDMPGHIKSVLVGVSQTIPIRAGRLALGRWQGLYLCEFRRRAGGRTLLVTIWGQ